MNKKYLIKRWNWLAGLFFAVLFFGMRGKAEALIEPEKPCTLQVSLGLNIPEDEEWQEDLEKEEITVHLYQVAGVDAHCRFHAEPGFERLMLETVDEETTAKFWEEAAKEAVTLVDTVQEVKTDRLVMNDGQGTLEGMSAGLYLVMPERVQTDRYEYTFLPGLVSLPGLEKTEGAAERWNYEVSVGLKPEREPLCMDIEIEKILEGNGTFPEPVFFLFLVETEREAEDGSFELLCSEFVTAGFSEPGVKTVSAGRAPVGSYVTVREVYAGASFSSVGESEKRFLAVPEEDGILYKKVTFMNRYSGPFIPSTGIRNRFDTGDGEDWGWEQIPCIPAEKEGEDAEEGVME